MRKRPPRLINEIRMGKRAVTPRTAILLGDYFRSGALFWMKLQAEYDIDRLQREGVQYAPNVPGSWTGNPWSDRPSDY